MSDHVSMNESVNETCSTVIVMWETLKQRFHQKIIELPQEALGLKIGKQSIGEMLYHNAEVELMFAEWYFGQAKPAFASAPVPLEDKAELQRFVFAANDHLVAAMRALPEEAWHVKAESPIGASTPIEAVSRLMYHTGIHAGQITFIQQFAPSLKNEAGADTSNH